MLITSNAAALLRHFKSSFAIAQDMRYQLENKHFKLSFQL